MDVETEKKLEDEDEKGKGEEDDHDDGAGDLTCQCLGRYPWESRPAFAEE